MIYQNYSKFQLVICWQIDSSKAITNKMQLVIGKTKNLPPVSCKLLQETQCHYNTLLLIGLHLEELALGAKYNTLKGEIMKKTALEGGSLY